MTGGDRLIWATVTRYPSDNVRYLVRFQRKLKGMPPTFRLKFGHRLKYRQIWMKANKMDGLGPKSDALKQQMRRSKPTGSVSIRPNYAICQAKGLVG
jgi:hypothetical protein